MATTEIYTLSLHDALPISRAIAWDFEHPALLLRPSERVERSEEHTSELQSHSDLVCRLVLEKKKKKKINTIEQETHPSNISTVTERAEIYTKRTNPVQSYS